MRTRLLLLLVLLLVAGGLVFSSSVPAFACTCAAPSPGEKALEDAIAEADAVFVGTVTSISRRDAPEGSLAAPAFGPVTYTFAVKDVIAGHLGVRTEVVSDASGAACGFRFREETRYVVFAYEREERLETNICSRTERFDGPTELGIVSPTKEAPKRGTTSGEAAGDRAEQPDDGGAPAAVVVVGAALLAGGAVVFFARRRTPS